MSVCYSSCGLCSIIVRQTTGNFDFLGYDAPCWSETILTLYIVCVPVPFAFVVLKDGFIDSPTAVLQELKDLVATKIAKYAVPEHFLVRPRPPSLT